MIVQAGAEDVLAHRAGVGNNRCRTHGGGDRKDARRGSEIDIEILSLRGPVVAEHADQEGERGFDAAADRPATSGVGDFRVDRRAEERSGYFGLDVANGVAAGLVSAVVGAVVGLAAWVAVAPAMENSVGARIDPFNVPWWLVLTGMVLAVVAAAGAAWWPARTASRVPTVSALSGRPPRPTRVHRSALLSVAMIVAGTVCLRFATRANSTDSMAGFG